MIYKRLSLYSSLVEGKPPAPHWFNYWTEFVKANQTIS